MHVVLLMEYMDLGSLESIRIKQGGTLEEGILGYITKPVGQVHLIKSIDFERVVLPPSVF